MDRPYIICHMVSSLDLKVTGDFLYRPQCAFASEKYYEIHRNFAADAFACGRVTMEGSFTKGRAPDLSAFYGKKALRSDFIAVDDPAFYAVAFDRRGRLGWGSGRIYDEDPGYDDSHIIEVLCEDTSDEYLLYLNRVGVSYIFAGERELDLRLALFKLRRIFGIKKLLLEGGSILNGAFFKEKVIDELSLVTAPVIAGDDARPLFSESCLVDFELIEAKPLGNSVVWLRYFTKG
ncbi:MAG: RibD family protein [Clostridia bacterium]|nr:RibD family protein [Clostridia bacterium]